MADYYNERLMVIPFLIKYADDNLSIDEKITALINILDDTTLNFILNLNPQHRQGIEDFQKVVQFIKNNQAAILSSNR